MAKRCPQNCGVYQDHFRRCPVCNRFLLKLPDAHSSNNKPPEPPIYKPKTEPPEHSQPRKRESYASPVVPIESPVVAAKQDYYPMRVPPTIIGRVMNFVTKDVKRSGLSKALDSIFSGAPYYFGDTMNAFQVFAMDEHGRGTRGVQVIIWGDIIDGQIYDGNEVRVWGTPTRAGSIKAKNIYNVTSSVVVSVRAIPSGAIRALAVVPLAGFVFLIANPEILGTILAYLLIGATIIIVIKIALWRLFCPRRYRRWY